MNEILASVVWALHAPESPYPTIMALVIGLEVGSFLNVVIYRVPIMWARHQTILDAKRRGDPPPSYSPFNPVVPRSRCPRCGHLISWWENIPVASYCLLKGKCRRCMQPISVRYPFVESLTGALFLMVFVTWRWQWHTAVAWGVIFAVTALVAILFNATRRNPPDQFPSVGHSCDK